jgi:hypothetical protein
MPRGRRNEDLVILQMALVGYQQEREKLDARIMELQARLKGKQITAAHSAPQPTPVKSKLGKRVMSAAARKRIGIAQKKRWAEHKKKTAADSK